MTSYVCETPVTTHRAVWQLGDYATYADEVLAPLGQTLPSTTGVGPGDHVLDVAAGTGNAAIAAAAAGAHVTAVDLTPELLQHAQTRAAEHGLLLKWREANAEALPFRAESFDVVLSSIGAMFAPRQQRTADEMARVCRRGGKISVLSWTPDGFYGRMLAAVRPFRPTMPRRAPQEAWWGCPKFVSILFGDHVSDIRTRTGALRVDRFGAPEACRDYLKQHYGPVINAYRQIAGDPVRVAALDTELADLCAEYLHDGVMRWEYLIFTARKR
ncbi:MAG: SAM-dependent methyltransferase [Mycobacterium sp.]|nr:MAG: SAM-dependent methyltransferase [Mycobacterium sp.]